MSLESLVPPLELCQQLQPGDFPESVMVWCMVGISNPQYKVAVRSPKRYHNSIPAPTLEEILNSIEKIDGITFAKGGIYYAKKQVLIESFYYPTNATAALRIWLRLNGREVKG